MIVTESTLQSWRIIILRGKFIVKNLAKIRLYFEEAEKVASPHIAIDMGEVTQIDSSAITILVNFQRRVIHKEGLLVLFGLSDDIAEIFSIAGIDKIFRICTNREDFERRYVHQNS